MRCLKKVFSFFLSIMLIFGASGSPCSAFDAPTHVYVTQRGLEIFLDILSVYFFTEEEIFFTEEDIEIILVYCVKPDEDETYGAYKYHFYNPVTGLNFMGENDSALTRFVDHFNRALHYMKLYYQAMANGNLEKARAYRRRAMEELGRALHFLGDLNTPVHTNNQTLLDTGFNFFFHVSFENTCKSVQDRVRPSMQRREFRYYEVNSLETVAVCSALLADDNLYALHEGFLSKEQVAENSIKNAQKAIAGLLYKFYLTAITYRV